MQLVDWGSLRGHELACTLYTVSFDVFLQQVLGNEGAQQGLIGVAHCLKQALKANLTDSSAGPKLDMHTQGEV